MTKNNDIYLQIKNWVQNQSKNIISFSPKALFKQIKTSKIDILDNLEKLCKDGILKRQFKYICPYCNNQNIIDSLCDSPNYCELCGEGINDPMHNSFLEYKILKRECDK